MGSERNQLPGVTHPAVQGAPGAAQLLHHDSLLVLVLLIIEDSIEVLRPLANVGALSL